MTGLCLASATLTPKNTSTGTYCVGGWVGPTAGLDASENGNALPTWNQTPDLMVIQPIA